jgi:hypothetical protein
MHNIHDLACHRAEPPATRAQEPADDPKLGHQGYLLCMAHCYSIAAQGSVMSRTQEDRRVCRLSRGSV